MLSEKINNIKFNLFWTVYMQKVCKKKITSAYSVGPE